MGIGPPDIAFALLAPSHHCPRARGARPRLEPDADPEVSRGGRRRDGSSARDHSRGRDHTCRSRCVFLSLPLSPGSGSLRAGLGLIGQSLANANDMLTGHRHFTALCASLEPEPVDPVAQFRLEVSRHFWGHVRGPFNVEDRDRAGIGRDWYENLGGRGTVKKEEEV